MLTQRFFSLAGNFFTILGQLGIIPFIWDQKSKTLTSCKISRKKCFYFLFLYIIWGLHLFLQSIRFYREGDIKRFNICYVFFIAWSLASISYSIFYWPNNGGLLAFNVGLQYSKYISKFSHRDNLYTDVNIINLM